MRTTIEMAREAAGAASDWALFREFMPEIHRLAELVRADERARMAEQPAQQRHISYFCPQCYWSLEEQPAQQQEPVLWQILNGVCHAGVRSTENLAKEAAAGMQKTHDLGGSLAAFHVRPLYTSPPASKPWVGLTDEEREIASWTDGSFGAGARWAEAKLKEKNNG